MVQLEMDGKPHDSRAKNTQQHADRDTSIPV